MSRTAASNLTHTDLADRMARLGVKESDIEERFVRSSGPGGQNINKTSTCVVLVHRPTGTLVRCQSTRCQGTNRVIARRLLLDKIEERRRTEIDAARRLQEKVRRQRRRPSRSARKRMLADKIRRSKTKQLRRPVAPGNNCD